MLLGALKTFEEVAEYGITKIDPESYPILKRLFAILLTFPVSTADCERGFSKMNLIKNKKRTRMKQILESLMLIYTSDENHMKKIDLRELSKVLAHRLWKRDGKKWASDQYMMSMI
tara:strand:- start:8 stop:355 length:348 start_codon:yes stop_codon:yes gene_type:complete